MVCSIYRIWTKSSSSKMAKSQRTFSNDFTFDSRILLKTTSGGDVRRAQSTPRDGLLNFWILTLAKMVSMKTIRREYLQGEKFKIPIHLHRQNKQQKKMAYMRSVSCHHLGNELHPRNHAAKSQSEVNLARLVVNKNAGKLSPMKQKRENRDSLASMRSLNSYLSLCEGIDVNYVEEDDCLLNNELTKMTKTPLAFTPKLQHQQSVASDASVNSLLSLQKRTLQDLLIDQRFTSTSLRTVRASKRKKIKI
ncbi:hypothetical protein OS493_023375 [Desmophyllum pertusum]|uniref:Uncharacterized protein n=1 Tax=Desmophyllum pertusum TaxID=174260 RepID=A0A9W9ZZE3_9CNID|nr:hypothetical protein OS493_023375 [Desmophyllum pertusum]